MRDEGMWSGPERVVVGKVGAGVRMIPAIYGGDRGIVLLVCQTNMRLKVRHVPGGRYLGMSFTAYNSEDSPIVNELHIS